MPSETPLLQNRYFRDVTPTDGVFETDINGVSVLGGPVDDRSPLRIRHADDHPQRLLRSSEL